MANDTLIFWGVVTLIIGTLYIAWYYIKKKYSITIDFDWKD